MSPYSQGLGYVPNPDQLPDPVSRKTSAATERLREQMLGKRKRPNSLSSAAVISKAGGTMQASKPRLKRPERDADSDDEEVGRSQFTKSVKEVSRSGSSNEQAKAAGLAEPSPVSASSHKARKSTSYMDQILAERVAKKAKRKKPSEE